MFSNAHGYMIQYVRLPSSYTISISLYPTAIPATCIGETRKCTGKSHWRYSQVCTPCRRWEGTWVTCYISPLICRRLSLMEFSGSFSIGSNWSFSYPHSQPNQFRLSTFTKGYSMVLEVFIYCRYSLFSPKNFSPILFRCHCIHVWYEWAIKHRPLYW